MTGLSQPSMGAAGRCAAAFAVAGLLTACAAISDLTAPAGSRTWIIPVENTSAQPARLFVAEDESPMGDTVGTVEPATVAPGATEMVTFTVPAGQGWAIFVNPGPNLGPLILAMDVPEDARGALPLTITVGPDGSPGVMVPGEPGWFGN